MITSDEKNHSGNENERQQEKSEDVMIYEGPRKINLRSEENSATIARNQIGGLLLLAR